VAHPGDDMTRDPFAVDPKQVAQSFSAASQRYEDAAILQRNIRTQLFERLDELALAPTTVLDLGSGTGEGARDLRRRYRNATVVATDIAFGMLQQAARHQLWWRRFGRVAGSAYALPYRNGSFDVVFSNLMFQWCDDIDAALAEVARVLRPGGRLLFSTFGPDTLHELRLAWAAADPESNHVNRFLDMHDIGSTMTRVGLQESVLDVDRIVRRYVNARDLMQELKAIGAHNLTAGRPRGLTGPRRFQTMLAAYETMRRDGQLPATYEVIYASAWGSEPQPEKTSSAREILIAPGSIRRRT
jgi:malonyl-CoA O-methyltransferase